MIWAIMTSVVTNVLGRVFWWMFVHSYLGYVPRSRIVGGWHECSALVDTALVFQNDYTNLHIYQQSMGFSVSPHLSQYLLLSIFFIVTILWCVVVLICTSLMANGDEIFYMLIAICVSSFVWCLMKSFAAFSVECLFLANL